MGVSDKLQGLRDLNLRSCWPIHLHAPLCVVGGPDPDALQTGIRLPEGLPLWPYESKVSVYLPQVIAHLITLPGPPVCRQVHYNATDHEGTSQVNRQMFRAHVVAEPLINRLL
jgi:hypothetical protein